MLNTSPHVQSISLSRFFSLTGLGGYTYSYSKYTTIATSFLLLQQFFLLLLLLLNNIIYFTIPACVSWVLKWKLSKRRRTKKLLIRAPNSHTIRAHTHSTPKAGIRLRPTIWVCRSESWFHYLLSSYYANAAHSTHFGVKYTLYS